MIRVTTATILDKRIQKNDGTYAVKLRVTFNREQKYYPLGKFLTPEQWNELQEEQPKIRELKRLKLHFAGIEKRAIGLIDDMENFSFPAFEKKFNDQPAVMNDVLDAIEKKKEKLAAAGSFNYAESYQSTHKSLTGFLNTMHRKKLKYSDITPEWLQQYEDWMRQNESSITTIGIYIRNLRTIINQAIEEGHFQKEFYPFGKRKYQIPHGKNVKKALTIEQIKMIVDHVPATEAAKKARDLWLFSYLCNGVNVTDIARLQYQNLSRKHITFIRAKTERSTKSNQKEIVIVRMPEIDALIDKWGVKPAKPSAYIFDLISSDDSHAVQFAKIKQATKTINKYMKRIGETFNFDLTLTTYTARHSFATVLKRSGAPIEFISESLGHKDLKTTENYLDSFEDDVRESYQKLLLNFKPKKTKTKS